MSKYDELESPQNKSDFQNLINESIQHRLQWMQEGGWEELYNKDGVVIEYNDVNWSKIKAIKTTTVFDNITTQRMVELLYAPKQEEYKKIMADLMGIECLMHVSEDICIEMSVYKAPPGVKNRSFLTVTGKVKQANGAILLVSESINHKDVPHTSKTIRGLLRTAILLIPRKDNKVQMIALSHINPMGSIPPAIINIFKSKVSDWVLNLKKNFCSE